MQFHIELQPLRIDVFPVLDFFSVDIRRPIEDADEYVVELVFDKIFIQRRLVNEGVRENRLKVDAHFLCQTSACSHLETFSRKGMTATGIGPEAAAMVFPLSAFLDKNFAILVENQNGE